MRWQQIWTPMGYLELLLILNIIMVAIIFKLLCFRNTY